WTPWLPSRVFSKLRRPRRGVMFPVRPLPDGPGGPHRSRLRGGLTGPTGPTADISIAAEQVRATLVASYVGIENVFKHWRITMIRARRSLGALTRARLAGAVVGLAGFGPDKPASSSRSRAGTALPRVFYKTEKVGDLSIFYGEAGPKDAPAVLLLHGFP